MSPQTPSIVYPLVRHTKRPQLTQHSDLRTSPEQSHTRSDASLAYTFSDRIQKWVPHVCACRRCLSSMAGWGVVGILHLECLVSSLDAAALGGLFG